MGPYADDCIVGQAWDGDFEGAAHGVEMGHVDGKFLPARLGPFVRRDPSHGRLCSLLQERVVNRDRNGSGRGDGIRRDVEIVVDDVNGQDAGIDGGLVQADCDGGWCIGG